MSDTPKTDAAEAAACNALGVVDVVDVEFARSQERTIVGLEGIIKRQNRTIALMEGILAEFRAAIQKVKP